MDDELLSVQDEYSLQVSAEKGGYASRCADLGAWGYGSSGTPVPRGRLFPLISKFVYSVKEYLIVSFI